MSIRTIIEINHDYLHDLIEDRSFLQQFLINLKGADPTRYEPPGIRVITQRHHSEKITVVVE